MSHIKKTSSILLAGIVAFTLGTVGCERRENAVDRKVEVEKKDIDVDIVDKSMEDQIQDDALVIGRVEIQKGPEADDVSIYLIDDAGKKYAVSSEDEGAKLANLNGAKLRVHGELGTLDDDSVPNTEAGVNQVINVQSYDILEFASTGNQVIMKEEKTIQQDGTLENRPLQDDGTLKTEPQQGIEQKAPSAM